MSQRKTDKAAGQRSPAKQVHGTDGVSCESSDIDEIFESYRREGGNNQSDEITQKNILIWFGKAKIKNLNNKDMDRCFAKVSRGKTGLKKDEFRDFVNEVAKNKKMLSSEIENLLKAAGGPSNTRGKRQPSGSPGKREADDIKKQFTNRASSRHSPKVRVSYQSSGAQDKGPERSPLDSSEIK